MYLLVTSRRQGHLVLVILHGLLLLLLLPYPQSLLLFLDLAQEYTTGQSMASLAALIPRQVSLHWQVRMQELLDFLLVLPELFRILEQILLEHFVHLLIQSATSMRFHTTTTSIRLRVLRCGVMSLAKWTP